MSCTSFSDINTYTALELVFSSSLFLRIFCEIIIWLLAIFVDVDHMFRACRKNIQIFIPAEAKKENKKVLELVNC